MSISRRELLEYALEGMEHRRAKIDDQIRELTAELKPNAVTQLPVGLTGTGPGIARAPKKRRKFSAATRRKMAAAQKARWAKLKINAPLPIKQVPVANKKRHVSAAGRKRIVAAVKARWAKAKAAKKGKVAGAGG